MHTHRKERLKVVMYSTMNVAEANVAAKKLTMTKNFWRGERMRLWCEGNVRERIKKENEGARERENTRKRE